MNDCTAHRQARHPYLVAHVPVAEIAISEAAEHKRLGRNGLREIQSAPDGHLAFLDILAHRQEKGGRQNGIVVNKHEPLEPLRQKLLYGDIARLCHEKAERRELIEPHEIFRLRPIHGRALVPPRHRPFRAHEARDACGHENAPRLALRRGYDLRGRSMHSKHPSLFQMGFPFSMVQGFGSWTAYSFGNAGSKYAKLVSLKWLTCAGS